MSDILKKLLEKGDKKLYDILHPHFGESGTDGLNEVGKKLQNKIENWMYKMCYWQPCGGCSDGHPSFWKTVTESKEWAAWEKSEGARNFDYDESRECGALGVNHWNEFVKFIKTL